VSRPSVDVVIPFAGSDAALDTLLETMGGLALGPADTMTIVDNGPPAPHRVPRELGERRRVIVETRLPSSYFARNQGAEGGTGEWLVFLDADVEPAPDLLDAYFAEPAGERVAVLAGGITDELDRRRGWSNAASRYADLTGSMSQSNTMASDDWAYAQTANAAVRRTALEEVGGFVAIIRSGGDADLCFRIRAAGWELDARETAGVVHRNRPTLRKMLRQRARHGSGARWLNRFYPGAFPARRSPGAVVWSLRQGTKAIAALARGDMDRSVLLGVGALTHWAFELGRLIPNDVRPRR
jgi:cellulose synthase/poly-beta-1,6-N-acetylglucosamine synthase-like glycosyltransferase